MMLDAQGHCSASLMEKVRIAFDIHVANAVVPDVHVG